MKTMLITALMLISTSVFANTSGRQGATMLSRIGQGTYEARGYQTTLTACALVARGGKVWLEFKTSSSSDNLWIGNLSDFKSSSTGFAGHQTYGVRYSYTVGQDGQISSIRINAGPSGVEALFAGTFLGTGYIISESNCTF